MRKKYTVQRSVFEYYPEHETGRELKEAEWGSGLAEWGSGFGILILGRMGRIGVRLWYLDINRMGVKQNGQNEGQALVS